MYRPRFSQGAISPLVLLNQVNVLVPKFDRKDVTFF